MSEEGRPSICASSRGILQRVCALYHLFTPEGVRLFDCCSSGLGFRCFLDGLKFCARREFTVFGAAFCARTEFKVFDAPFCAFFVGLFVGI